MKVETNELMTVKNYALKNNVTSTTVYNWIISGKIECVTIDSIKFIKTKK